MIAGTTAFARLTGLDSKALEENFLLRKLLHRCGLAMSYSPETINLWR